MSCPVRTSLVTLVAAKGEIIKKEIDFAGGDLALAEIIGSISSVTSSIPSEVAISGSSYSTTIVQAVIDCTNAVIDKLYKITATIVTTSGQTLIGAGWLRVGSP